MKRIITTLVFFIALSITAQETKKVFGKVSDGTNPIHNVNVSVVNKENATTTNSDGVYEIYVAEGDKLQFSYTGLKTITIKIEDITRVLNPIMVPDVTELDEVVIQNSKRRSQKDLEEDYTVNKNIIRTAYGFLDAERSSGQIRMLHEDEINPVSLCVLDMLRSRFPGIIISGDCNIGGEVFSARGLRAGPMIWDVDGQIFANQGPFTPSAPIWIDINNIKRVAILNSLANTVSYGNLGAAGVIVINTISGTKRENKIVDQARLKNNFATAKVLDKSEIAKNMPVYQKDYDSSASFEDAKQIFNSYNNQYASSPYFFIDSYNYFHKKWNETDFADSIINDNFDLFRGNAVLLKALAYNYEEQGRYKKANEVYKDAFILRPNYAQSYMDMANSYRNIKQPKQSAAMHARYGYLIEESFMKIDTLGFGPIMNREYNNLLMLEKEGVIESRKAKKLYVAEEDFEGTRLVFEWNDSEAEFELQFVNPGNQFHTWKHSLADNTALIEHEKELGYNVTEYLVDSSLPGTWKVNVNYLGNKSLTPTYLKATIYHNYGEKSQRKETKVFKLTLKNVNQELFAMQIAANIKVQ